MNYSFESQYQSIGLKISGIQPGHDVLPNVSGNMMFCPLLHDNLPGQNIIYSSMYYLPSETYSWGQNADVLRDMLCTYVKSMKQEKGLRNAPVGNNTCNVYIVYLRAFWTYWCTWPNRADILVRKAFQQLMSPCYLRTIPTLICC